jgi:hypothetical protein
MMDFLRRLAPSREPAAGRAVAVLPSRYASDHPLRAAPSASMTTEDEGAQDFRSPSPHAVAPPAVDSAAAHQTVSTEAALPPPAARTDAGRVPLDRSDSRGISRPPRRGPADGTAFDVAVRRHVEDAQPDDRAREPAAPRRVEPAPREAAFAAEVLPVSPAPRRRRTPPTSAVLPVSMASAAAGIPHPAFPARVRLPADPPTVIHVTIDRIDVRAPATPQSSAASARSRTSAPSVSLGDYLRARRPGRAGGAS